MPRLPIPTQPSRPGQVDLDDSSRCPTAGECAGCGVQADEDGVRLEVATVTYGIIGVGCMSLCEDCVDEGVLPPIGLPDAVRSVMAHCEHLGITADQMAGQLDARFLRAGYQPSAFEGQL